MVGAAFNIGLLCCGFTPLLKGGIVSNADCHWRPSVSQSWSYNNGGSLTISIRWSIGRRGNCIFYDYNQELRLGYNWVTQTGAGRTKSYYGYLKRLVRIRGMH